MKTQRLASIVRWAGIMYIAIGIILLLAFWPVPNTITASFSLMAVGVNLLATGLNLQLIERAKMVQKPQNVDSNSLQQGQLTWLQIHTGLNLELWIAQDKNTYAVVRQLAGEAPNWEYGVLRLYMSPWWKFWDRFFTERTLREGRAYSRENAMLIAYKALA